MKFSVLLSAIIFVNVFVAQNLVPNPSFETYTTCTDTVGGLISNSVITPWTAPTKGTSDFFTSACSVGCLGLGTPCNIFSYQPARTGMSYAGFIAGTNSFLGYDNEREYLQVQLSSPLVAGTEYDVEFYVSLGGRMTGSSGIDKLGAYISNGAVSSTNTAPLNFTPQIQEPSIIADTLNWTLISGTYTATGGEDYITIGNFYDGASINTQTVDVGIELSYYFVDDVSVKAATCFEIEKILVDACDNGLSSPNNDEGKNEMVTFRVGNQDLNVSDLSVNWPSSNPWGGVIQNAATAQLITTVNSSITACGYVKEPVGGVLPAGKEILLITSYEFNPFAHSFANLNDTLIVIFQDASTGAGHFKNYNASSTVKTLSMSFTNPSGCSDQVSYNTNLLVNQSGTSGGISQEKNGAFVSFTPDGTPTYDNLGCQIITGMLGIDISSDMLSVCGGETISLDAVVEGGDYSEILWTSQHGVLSANNVLSTTLAVSNNISSSFYIYGSVIKYGCNGNPNDTITDSIQITMGVNPNVSISTSNNLLCTGQTVTLTANGADTYLWNNGSTTNPLVITTGGNYSVTGTNGCGSDNDAVSISEIQAPTPIIVPSPMYSCDSNELHQVDLSTNVCDNCTYTWSDGSTGTQFSGNEPNYSVVIQNACGTQTVNYHYDVITVLVDITVQDSIGNAPFTVPFSSVSSSGSYSWDFDNGNSSGPLGIENPIETFYQAGEYLVTLTISEQGCTATAYQTIIVNGNLPTGVVIPNIFTPNGDGENDSFFIETINGSNMSGSIFNRWGRKVHELNGLDAKWNGGKYNEGTYYYIIEVTFADGSTKEYEGSFMMTK